MHAVFSALLLALSAWRNGFSSEMLLQLQFVSDQCTWQDQEQARTRSGAKARQGRVWRMASERQCVGNKVRLWLSTDLVPLLGFFILWA